MADDETKTQIIERGDNWLALKRQAVGWVRRRAPGLVVGVVGGLLAGVMLGALIPFAGLPVLGMIVGGYFGQKNLGDLSAFTQRDPAIEATKEELAESKAIAAAKSTPSLSRQEARAASIEKMAAGNVPEDISSTHFRDNVNRQRGVVTPVTPPPGSA